MNGQRILIRLVGTLTCVAAVATGWDAEAARCHRRRACCYDTCCTNTCNTCNTCNYDSCCTSACTTSCTPACERVCWSYRDPCSNCCVRTCGYRVIDSTCCVASVPTCCEVVVATTARPATADAIAATSRPAARPVSARR